MKDNLVSIKTYAELCGVSITAIRNRIHKKKISITRYNKADGIDTSIFPPQKRLPAGRPKNDDLLAA